VSEKMTLEEVDRLGREEFVSRLGSVFESSPWVAERAWRSRPFGGFSELYGAMVRAVDEASEERRMDLIRAHPDLAGRTAVAGELTPESKGEQASAGLDRLTPEEYEAFTRHTKESILQNAACRLGNSREEEVEVALGEIAKIARLRLRELVETDEAPRENRARR
jgi:2-oxo-4-hydroxy-4-carboxy-5-ureidoimidazoline decarboxylase